MPAAAPPTPHRLRLSSNARRPRGPGDGRRRRLALAAAAVAALVAAGIGLVLATRPPKPVDPYDRPAIQPSGHVVTHLRLLARRNPVLLRAITFRITPPTARGVMAQLNLGGSWYGCSNTAGEVLCPFGKDVVRVRDVSDLTVRVAG